PVMPVINATRSLISLSSSLPDFPRRLAAEPKLLKLPLVAQRVDRLPEAVELIGHQIAVGGEPFERLVLPLGRVAVDGVDHRRFTDEEAAVDPTGLALGLFAER